MNTINIDNNNYIGQQITINIVNSSSPSEIIFNFGKQNEIKGLRYGRDNLIMLIIELNDQTRIWVSPKEIKNIIHSLN
jgi:hypothetical protein